MSDAWWYELTTNPDFWKNFFILALCLTIIFKFKLLSFIFAGISLIINGLFNGIKFIYVIIILSIYGHKYDTNMIEYKKGIECTYKGIKCKHISGVDTIIIDHPGIIKPFALIGYFILKIDDRLTKILIE